MKVRMDIKSFKINWSLLIGIIGIIISLLPKVNITISLSPVILIISLLLIRV